MSIYFDDGIKYQFSLLGMTEFSSFRRSSKNEMKAIGNTLDVVLRFKAIGKDVVVGSGGNSSVFDITSNICVQK